MKKSESIKELASALVKFNAEMTSIAKDSKNPMFKQGNKIYTYTSLDALITATREPLGNAGLTVIQFPSSVNDEIGVVTIILHESGEFIESDILTMKAFKQAKGGDYYEAKDAQSAGGLITYLRRYSYLASLNLATGEDDNGNQASGLTPSNNASQHYNYNNNSNSNNSNNSSSSLSDKQIGRIWGLAKGNNINNDVVIKMINSFGVADAKQLNKNQYDELCTKLENGQVPASQGQLDSIKTLMVAKGVNKNKMQEIVLEVVKAKKGASELTSDEATGVINHLLTLKDVSIA